jgi:hypothetical protein
LTSVSLRFVLRVSSRSLVILVIVEEGKKARSSVMRRNPVGLWSREGRGSDKNTKKWDYIYDFRLAAKLLAKA